MRYQFTHSVSAVSLILLFAIHTFAVSSQIDFFASTSFGGNNAMFYATEPGDFDGDGKVDVVTSSYDKIYVFSVTELANSARHQLLFSPFPAVYPTSTIRSPAILMETVELT
jgi:hypothetical protein